MTRWWALCVCIGVFSPLLSAQTWQDKPGVKDTFTISSGYFSTNYANNIDYVQFMTEESRLEERVALWGYEHMESTPVWRGVYLVTTNLFNYLSLLDVSYHEWGHASRIVAGGGTATLSKCYSKDNVICPAPRDFFGYVNSQLFNLSGGGGGAKFTGGEFVVNGEVGRAPWAIISGAGVNNEMLVADKLNESNFIHGTGNIFSQWGHWGGQFAIAKYAPALTGDMNNVTKNYQTSGVDSNITENDLRNINGMSVISGSTVSTIKATYDFVTKGTVNVKPWTVGGFLVPNQFNYISSRGITRKWASGYEWDDNTKLLVSYEYVVRGDSFTEPGLGVYKNFGGWDALIKVSGKTMGWANVETAFSKRLNKNWKLTATAYMWDSRSLMGERNTLDLSSIKTYQGSVGVAYEY